MSFSTSATSRRGEKFVCLKQGFFVVGAVIIIIVSLPFMRWEICSYFVSRIFNASERRQNLRVLTLLALLVNNHSFVGGPCSVSEFQADLPVRGRFKRRQQGCPWFEGAMNWSVMSFFSTRKCFVHLMFGIVEKPVAFCVGSKLCTRFGDKYSCTCRSWWWSTAVQSYGTRVRS